MYTLNSTEVHCVCYGICGYHSNSMKSNNPHSGFYKADTSRTLDLNGGNPSCNQGGICVVEIHGTWTLSERFTVAYIWKRNLSDVKPKDGYWWGNVPLILEIRDYEEKENTQTKVVTDTEWPGGDVMNWTHEGVDGTLRREMGGHPPIVVVEKNDNFYRKKILWMA